MTPQQLLRSHGIEYRPEERYYTICPECSKDRKKSRRDCLGVTIDANGRVRWGCNHCGWTGPKKGSGGHAGTDELTTYVYRDADGVPRFRKVRNRPNRQPRFWVEQADGNGGWKKGTKGVDTSIIYRADEVGKAIAVGREICVVEGEKDVNNLWQLDVAATCNAHGASEVGKKPKWTKEHSEQLRGADIVVFNDNDAAGYAHADAVCRSSIGVAKRIRRLDLRNNWPEIPKGGDVSDWLAVDDHASKLLKALIDAAPDYQPSEQTNKDNKAGDDDAELERLARLSLLDYERGRKEAVEKLGVRQTPLDKLVAHKRKELGLDEDNGKQGQAIKFAEPEPWPEPVEGAALLDAITKVIRSHVIMSDHAAHACALWVAHTYLLDQLMISPRLAITSPTKGCGKTTLLDVLGELVMQPLAAANCSAAAIFRVVEGYRPCLLIDEADTFVGENEELRGVLNSGHRRGGAVLRTVGDEHEPRRFATFAACAIALIGSLPATLADRAAHIDLKRRKASEAITPFRIDRVEHLTILARKLARWSKDNAEAIAAIDPELPAGMFNRAADNWRPLLAIAEAAGGGWPKRAREAALADKADGVEDAALVEVLLGDIRDIFTALGKDRISSAELIEKLCEITPRPWAEFGKSGKPLTQNKLARVLKPLGITPKVLRIGDETPAGYERWQFDEAFERYLQGGERASKPQHLNKCDEIGTSDPFQTSTPGLNVEVRKSQKPNTDGLCLSVEVQKGGNGYAGNLGLSIRTIEEVAEWAVQFHRRCDGADADAELAQALRERLVNRYDVFPGDLEVEAKRVMDAVFRT
jgi:putative DNA primase/helicase